MWLPESPMVELNVSSSARCRGYGKSHVASDQS
jgi:hypothetical protein